MTIAPVPQYAERAPTSYGVSWGQNVPGNKGDLRFEEGIASDTDVPNDFVRGAFLDTTFAPGRFNHNTPDAQYKHADETMQERAHVGSASWIEAPTMLSDFVHGAGAGQKPPSFEVVRNSGAVVRRMAPTVITD